MKPPGQHVRCKNDEARIDAGHVWDQAAGDRVCKFLRQYVTLQNGQPFDPLPYQRDFIDSVYCWKRPDGRRSIKLALLTLGRKNGKTELLTGLTAYHLLADNDPRPKCASCAVDREQASQIFDGLLWSRDHNEKLRAVLHPVGSQKLMEYPAKRGSYRSLSSDATGAGKLGTGYGFVVYDELAFHRNDGLWTALKNSGDSKPNSLQVVISTAGWNKNGAFYTLYQHAKKVLAGEVIDTSFQPWVFETPEGANLDDPAVWRLANPGLGVTLYEDDFREQWARAKTDNAGKLDFTRLKFNSWTEAETTWLDAGKWDDCKGDFPDLDGAPCHVGIDAGHTTDLTAVVAVFPVNGRYYVRSWGFVPRSAAEQREKQNEISYQRFTLDKSLTVVPGNCVGFEEDLIPHIDGLIKRYDVRSITLDKWQLLQLSQHYMRKGKTVYEFAPFHSKFNEPMQGVERAVLDKKLIHEGNALLRWQVGHCQVDRDNRGYCKPSKPTNAAKIDNIVALIMAFSQAMQHGQHGPKQSVYDQRGVFLVG